MSYLKRRVLAKPRLILDEMCHLYGKFASYLRRVLCKTRLIFPRINGPIVCCCFFSVPVPLICLAPHFRLLRVCEESQHKGDLEGIDALLGKYLFGRYNLRSFD